MFETKPELEMFLCEDDLSFNAAFPSIIHDHHPKQSTGSEISANGWTSSIDAASILTHKMESDGLESQYGNVTTKIELTVTDEVGAGRRKSSPENIEVTASAKTCLSSETDDDCSVGTLCFKNSSDLNMDKGGKNNQLHNEDYEMRSSAQKQCSLPDQTMDYKVVKSEPVSDDEDLPITFAGLQGLHSCDDSRDDEQHTQRSAKPIMEHTADTELRDASVSIHIDQHSSVAEEKGAVESFAIKLESYTEVAEMEQTSELGCAGDESEEERNNESCQQLASSGAFKSAVRLSRTAENGWEACSQENAAVVTVLPTGLYQNVHMMNSDKKPAQQKALPPKASPPTMKKAGKRKRQAKTRLPKNALAVQHDRGCKTSAAGVGSSCSEEPSGVLEDVPQKLDGRETVSPSRSQKTAGSRSRSKRKANGCSEVNSLPPRKRKKKNESAKVHQCPICNATFTCATNQKIHMRLVITGICP